MNLKSGYAGHRAVGAAVRRALLAAAVAASALPSSQVFAQEAPEPQDEPLEEVIVTGSILRRTDAETPSPVTVISAEDLAERGINTVSEAVQRLSANNAGTIQAGWNTGFNFASGATAPALRGLTVQNTLSVVDGLRMAPYPFADDGQRNFVDLNTIPERRSSSGSKCCATARPRPTAPTPSPASSTSSPRKKSRASTSTERRAISQDGGGDENRIDADLGSRQPGEPGLQLLRQRRIPEVGTGVRRATVATRSTPAI